MDAGLEASSGEDAGARSRVIIGVPVAIEMRLDRDQHSPGTVIMTVGEGNAEGGQLRVGVGT
ncbi:hypothetical protein GCM10008023_38550 [Sphingomonas glacialis]|uniref:Uncharacterized protein n=1 Tax=Sphingomonas glacialis TaxID=658225 RepID=A0ABQ3M2I5_9SPHN|nr:hypothetical protein GCM10008023_38550 [Sphingomonas glacialis]